MNDHPHSTAHPHFRDEIGLLLRGDAAAIRSWTEEWVFARLAFHAAVIIAGAGLYGAAMGWWRAPLQGLYVAIKFPLIVLLVAAGNSLLNGMLAPLLGINLRFRQSFLAILMSFAIASAILGSFSPIIAFVTWNAPVLSTEARIPVQTYSAILLTHVIVIAFAGIVANLRLTQWLRRFEGGQRVSGRVLVAWLAGNLFLGSQLSWILRPFIGSPGLPVQFLREEPLKGNFYEAVWHSVLQFLNP